VKYQPVNYPGPLRRPTAIKVDYDEEPVSKRRF
jgi:hypothetical protein